MSSKALVIVGTLLLFVVLSIVIGFDFVVWNFLTRIGLSKSQILALVITLTVVFMALASHELRKQLEGSRQ